MVQYESIFYFKLQAMLTYGGKKLLLLPYKSLTMMDNLSNAFLC